MKNSRTVQLLMTVIFLGIILSCTAYFGITALIALPNSYLETPYHEENALPDTLNTFDRGVYLDARQRQLMISLDYRLFSQVSSSEVVVGKEDFLFPLREDDYDYLADYTGDALYDDAMLDLLAKSIEKRSIAYANAGAEYLLVVIPNSQTIYGEYLPSAVSSAAGENRLSQLSAYLADLDTVNFLDLTQAMQDAKSDGVLFNNTENSINALGANTVYRAVLEQLPDDLQGRYSPIASDSINIFTHYTGGKALAKLAGIEDLVRNRTLSLVNDTELKYRVLEKIAGMEITYIKAEYKDEISNRPALLLEFSDEWDKIQLMPYFSNTFGTVAYKTYPSFSLYAVDYLKPNLVIQFVHENELDSLLDSAVLLSYNDGLKEGDDPFVAMAPSVLGIAQNAADRICIVGSCEAESVISLEGEGIISAQVSARNERFVIEAVFETGTQSTVRLIASVEGKIESSATELELSLGAFEGEQKVMVGSNSMLFHTGALTLTNIGAYSQTQLQRIRTRYLKEAENFSTAVGKKVRSVYVYIPDKTSIYRDALAAQNKLPLQTRLSQLRETLANAEYVTVFDLSQSLPFIRPADRLYLQTGSTLSPFGALSVYRLIMDELAEDDPAMVPLTYQDYDFVQETVPGGDLIELLGLDPASITEKIITQTPKKSSVSCTALDGETVVDESEALLYINTDESLPVAIVRRDLFGTPLLPYLAEHFSRLYVLEEGNFELSDAFIRQVNPDYIFTVSHEYYLPLN
ncbi:MAG: hypothetical protein IJF49_05730 [Clostridia bacterium]|nr:hypothetical protein [Clostridia bacterium]